MAAVVALASCTKDEWPDQPDWSQIPNPDEEIDDGLLKPAACDNNIVAHRGGAAECNAPDNSLASLQYAIDQGCYASECDIYWTGDDNVVVAHADGNCRINGMHPWEHSLADLRAAGALSNGEQLPSLEDFINAVKDKDCCTRLWLDIKNITYIVHNAMAEAKASGVVNSGDVVVVTGGDPETSVVLPDSQVSTNVVYVAQVK